MALHAAVHINFRIFLASPTAEKFSRQLTKVSNGNTFLFVIFYTIIVFIQGMLSLFLKFFKIF